MRSRHSIARRITIALSALIILAVSLTAVLTFFVYVRMEERMIDKLIQTESTRLISRISRFGGSWQGPFERDMGPSMFAWGEAADKPARGMPTELRALPLGLHYLKKEDRTWHVVIAPAMDGRLYVLYDSVVLKQQTRDFSLALLAIVAGCSLLALLISSVVARWLITPLNMLAERLARWVPDGQPQAQSHANEADRLMAVFNRVQDQVDAAIANQREFSANLHHEIRTPLTIIQGDAELLSMQGDPARDGPRLRRIIQSVRDIEQSLAGTYALTHAHADPPAPVCLHTCVQDILESLRLEADAAGLATHNRVPPQSGACLSRHALMTVIRNIARNALLHAAPATFEIAATDDGLRFTDTGPGIDAHELPHLFERYYSNRRTDQRASLPTDAPALDQTGLGLAIAKRVCDMQGWTLDVVSPVTNGRGTRFTLRFQP